MNSGRKSSGRRTQQERTSGSKEKLLMATMELIGENGFRGTTLEDIGRRAEVSRGLVTYHFGAKDTLFREVIERIRFGAQASIATAESGKRGLDALDHMVEGYLRGYPSELPGSRAVFVAMVESFTSMPELQDVMRSNDELFREGVATYLEDAVQLNQIAYEFDIEAAAILIVAVLRGTALQWLVSESFDIDSIVSTLQQAVRQILTAGTE